MELRTYILTKNDCYKAGRYITPKGIMVHSTGANNPYLRRYLPGDELIGFNQYNNHWDMSNVGACVHAFIGKDRYNNTQVYQTLPWTMRGWHCGRSGNDTHISFEICEDNLLDGSYWLSTKNAAVELCAYLCKEFNFDPMGDGIILDHATGNELGIASGHSDIRHWWSKYNYTLNDFRKEVKAKMAAMPDIQEMVKTAVNEILPNAMHAYFTEHIKEFVDELKKSLPVEPVYNTIDELPKWCREEITPLIKAGVVQGDGKNLGLTTTIIRILMVLWRIAGPGKEDTV